MHVFVDEIDLPKIDMSRSAFAKAFTERGLKDAQERSLHQLRMDGRMLRHPFSYLIYSDTFSKMPPEALDSLWTEIGRILETHPDAKNRWSR